MFLKFAKTFLSQTKALTVDEELIAIEWLCFAFIALCAFLLNCFGGYNIVCVSMYNVHADGRVFDST